MLTFIASNWTWFAVLIAIICAVYGERSDNPKRWTLIVMALAAPALLVSAVRNWFG